MAKPTQSIFPIENGRLTTVLDCNNLQLINLDESNLEGGGGNGAAHTVTFIGDYSGDVITADQAVFLDGDIGATISGGVLSEGTFIVAVTSSTVVQISESVSPETDITFTFDRIDTSGNDTGTTEAILKGDGDHGFADAVADVDYATPDLVATKEPLLPTTSLDAQLLARHNPGSGSGWFFVDPAILGGNDTGSSTAILMGDGTGGFEDAVVDVDYASVASVDAKVSQTDFDTYVEANDDAVALKANTDDVNDALDLKANSDDVDAALDLKEPLLPTSPTDGWILSGNTDDTKAWVDPVTLGTTNQTFTDGASNTDTSWNSDQANFVSPDDVGLTISGTNIQPGTHIASVTDENTIVLDQATTGTGSLLTFTIYNRLTIPVGGGTVTSVAVNNTAVNDLLTVNVSNPTTSPNILLTKPNVAAKTFYGNATASSSVGPTFMNQAGALAALDVTTAGRNLMQQANPGTANCYQKFLGTPVANTAVTILRTDVAADIGAEPALTFTSPLVRGASPNQQVISMPAAAGGTPSVSGYLTGSDWVAFNAKLSSTYAITTTSPLRIDGAGSAQLTGSGRTLSILQSAGDLVAAPPVALVDGYLSGADHSLFVNKPPNSRTLAVIAPLTMTPGIVSGTTTTGDLSANRTVSMPAASSTTDGYMTATMFNNFSAGSGTAIAITTPTPATLTVPIQTPPVTRVILGTTLTTPLTIILPPASGYSGALNYPFIEIVDITANGVQTTFGVTVAPTSGNQIDNALSITLPKSQRYIRFNSNGNPVLNQGAWSSTKYYVDTFRDPLNATKQVQVAFDSDFPVSTTRLFTPSKMGNSVSIVPPPLPSGSGPKTWIQTISADGTVTPSAITSNDIVPSEFAISNAPAGTVTVPSGVTSVKNNVALSTGTRQFIFPNVDLYDAGETIRFYDTTASASETNIAQVISSASYAFPNTFNGSTTINLTEPSFNRIFTADPVAHNWNVSSGSSLQHDLWNIVTPAAGVATIPVRQNVVQNHHRMAISSGVSLAFNPTPQPGNTGKIKVVSSTGPYNITVPNYYGKTPSTEGTGIIATSTGTSTEDLIGWDFDGINYNFYVLGRNFVGAAAAGYNTATDSATGTTTGSYGQGDTSTTRYRATRFVASQSYVCGKVVLRLSKNPALVTNYNLFCAIYSDTGANAPSALIGSASDPVSTSTLTTAEGDVTFNPNTGAIPLSSGTTYWVVYWGSNTTVISTDTTLWYYETTTNDGLPRSFKAGNTLIWTSTAPNTARPKFITYRP